LQQYAARDPEFDIWKKYGKVLKTILNSHREGSNGVVHMLNNGLLSASLPCAALTWMDAFVDDCAVTPRGGSPVEVNALWYNAVCQALEWASEKDKSFVRSWEGMPEKIAESFIHHFWNEEAGYLADVVDGDFRDMAVRPNQILAASMPHSPLSPELKKSVLDVVESELLTPKGLRTLAPKNEAYKGVYEGDQRKRDLAYHQGTVWPWLLEHFCRVYLDVHRNSGVSLIRRLYEGFEEDLSMRGIGSISGVYDGNPPHFPKGAISQATGVSALLRIGDMLDEFTKTP
jgi:predicted glycogen debranching enzyme